MSRIITEAAATVIAALALGACADTESPNAQEGTTGENPGITVAAEDGVGTAEEAVNPLPPAQLPYAGRFWDLWHHLETRHFVIPRLAALHVAVHATWNDPSSACRARYLKISLYHANGVQAGIQNIFRTDGKIQGASWQNLEPGTYYLDFEVQPAYRECKLAGGVSITL